jgi:ferredoxin
MTDGKARRVVAEIAEAVVDKCKESAESCPVDAITVDS